MRAALAVLAALLAVAPLARAEDAADPAALVEGMVVWVEADVVEEQIRTSGSSTTTRHDETQLRYKIEVEQLDGDEITRAVIRHAKGKRVSQRGQTGQATKTRSGRHVLSADAITIDVRDGRATIDGSFTAQNTHGDLPLGLPMRAALADLELHRDQPVRITSAALADLLGMYRVADYGRLRHHHFDVATVTLRGVVDDVIELDLAFEDTSDPIVGTGTATFDTKRRLPLSLHAHATGSLGGRTTTLTVDVRYRYAD